jgi:hypothetical protein
MEVLQLSVSKRRLNSSSSRSTKLSSRSVDNSRRRSPGKLRLSSSRNMRISNRRNSSLSSSRRRSACNLPLSSRCNKYNILCNRRSPGNLHCRRGTRPGNLFLKMRFLICYWDKTGPTKIQAWCTYVVRSKCKGYWTKLCQVGCLCHGTQ